MSNWRAYAWGWLHALWAVGLVFWFWHTSQAPTTAVVAVQPSDCAVYGLKPTGWEFQASYRGGINNGGASSMITYECR